MKIFISLFLSLLVSTTYSQSFDDVIRVIQSGKRDANYLVSEYLKPLLESPPYGLNQGWYNTAKPHRLGGFDLNASVSAVFIPNADLSYTVDNSKLEQLVHVKADDKTPSTDPVPTFFGTAIAPRYRFKNLDHAFDGPSGIDFKKQVGVQAVPVPMFNLGIGLPAGFEVKGRFLPTTKIGSSTTVSLWGVGVMYDIKQHFHNADKLPFDLSIFGAYTALHINVTDVTNNQNVTSRDQHAEFATSGATLQALISKKISVLTIYGGVGYNKGWSNVKVLGTYSVKQGAIQTKDPVDLSIVNSSPRITAGARIKLAIIVLSIDYTLQKYSTATLGIGLDFGK